METITSWQTLMMLAKDLGDARKSGDEEKIQQARQAHDSYRDLCLRADCMSLGVTIGNLAEVFKDV